MMAESTAGDAGAGQGFDLSQFFQVFFEEAGENLDRMEQLLLGVDIERADDETLNAIFRCAHSVKGGAATFGFADVAELTHEMETLLDRLRRHELAPTASMVDVLLQAGDALRALLARQQDAGAGEPVDTADLLAAIRATADGPAATAASHGSSSAAAAAQASAVASTARTTPALPAEPAPAAQPTGQRTLELLVGPLASPAQADDLVELFNEIADLGTIERLDAGQAADGMRRFKITTSSPDDDLLDLFTFHIDRTLVRLSPLGPGYGFFDGAPGAPAASAAARETVPCEADVDAALAHASGGDASAESAPPQLPGAPDASASRAGRAATRAAPAETSTLRVSVEKVDQLINLVGELVITQAMLAQNSARIDPSLHQQMAAGLADLDRNTRNLQEAVMSIRMIPMSTVFARFPRMLRDLAGRLGKKVDFVTHGEATELDKGMIEKIIDPLTHLVRNSCDHGIELPAERLAAGKTETGTISLSASHQGGSIAIEVCDDGRGLSREKLLAKARERGIDVRECVSDADVWNLVFAPGFSTAAEVTDVSGRGVGMDVVKKNITSLGGRVEIDSCEGRGMSVRVRLPLTLAIMDGMSVAVGSDCYIVPLASVVESFQAQAGMIRTIGGGGRVVAVRDEYLPVVSLRRVFGCELHAARGDSEIMVVVESEGRRAALVVDALLGQQQVVVKNLEANYRKVDGISGATILGDGRVALILDIGGLARGASAPGPGAATMH